MGEMIVAHDIRHGLKANQQIRADGLRRRDTIQNAFIESFNGRLRDEFLNETLFSSLTHARSALSNWRSDYNDDRPHSGLSAG